MTTGTTSEKVKPKPGVVGHTHEWETREHGIDARTGQSLWTMHCSVCGIIVDQSGEIIGRIDEGADE